MEPGEQVKRLMVGAGPGRSRDLVIPNSKLKLMDQLREVMPLQQTQISGMFTDSSARLASCQLVQFVSFGAGLSVLASPNITGHGAEARARADTRPPDFA